MNRSLLKSASFLLTSNLIALALALSLRWNLFEVVVLYWIQAFIIAVYQRRKIRDMVAFTLNRSRQKQQRLSSLSLAREGMHNGFAVIYALFWLMEGALLLSKYLGADNLSVDPLALLLACAVFGASHHWSYRTNRKTDERRVMTVAITLIHPLFRMLLPLHMFTLLIGFSGEYSAAATATWMLMKTVVDVAFHVEEHKTSRLYAAA